MADAAREQPLPVPAERPPSAPGWRYVQDGLASSAAACARSVGLLEEVAALPPEQRGGRFAVAALAVAQETLASMRDFGALARLWAVDDEVIEAERQRAVDEYKQSRWRLRGV